MSRNKFVERTIMRFKMSKRAARRFVPGEKLEDAIRTAKELNGVGIKAGIDHLGESVEDEALARKMADIYIQILEAIAANGIDSNISVKPTQLGLGISNELCRENVERIVKKATEYGNHVRMDMEDSSFTQKTLDVFKTIHDKYPNVGIVLQTYLYRTDKDVEDVIENGYGLRICKGAYNEPSSIAFPKKAQVDENFIKLLERLLGERARKNGVFVGVATHDDKIIDWTKNFVRENGVGKEEFEFQMLYGIRSNLQRKLVEDGFQTRVYIPFGTHWYPYYMRRLAERPANLLFFAKTLLRE
jgi:proline dehydrogenase